MNIFRWLRLFLFLFFIACDKPLPNIEGVDLTRWEADKNGCDKIRLSMREAIDQEKQKLLSLDQMQIVELLGRPDQNELSERNQKFFHYFIEPSGLCKGDRIHNPARLVIRFNAMGLAKEVAIE
jgi:hypothetical protein